MGELAALATAVCWAISSIFFTATSRQIGALTVNRIRLIFTAVLTLITHTLVTGHPLPLDAEPERWLWLGGGGVVTLMISDTLLFQAYAMLGNRLGSLMMAGTPVLSTLLALALLGEVPSGGTLLGMLLCVGGIAVVVLERKNGAAGALHGRTFTLGLLSGVGAATCQAFGMVLTKRGLLGGFPPISGVMIRTLVALVVMWGLTLLSGQAGPTLRALTKNRGIPLNLLGGSFIGTFVGVWLSQVALQLADVGVASTLISMSPVVLLPIARWYYKEAVSARAVLGTLLALAGVAIIFI